MIFRPKPGSSNQNDRNIVSRLALIGRHQGERLNHRLRHQHPVERIAVMPRQSSSCQGVSDRYRKRVKAIDPKMLFEIALDAQLAAGHLDRDLPHRGGADEYSLAGENRLPCLTRQICACGEPPQENVGV